MKKNRLIGIFFGIFLFFSFQTISAADISRNLKQGDSGPDVIALQKILNEDPETLIAQTGPGSYGQETSYFGAKTYDAVIRFQQKYREKILIPGGLTAPTGYVGTLTRVMLASLAANPVTDLPLQPVATVPPQSQSSAGSVTGSVVSGQQATNQQNPNLDNSEAFLQALETLGKEKGYSDSQLATMRETVKTGLGTSTDLKKQFLAEFSKYHPVSNSLLSFSSLFPKSSLWDKIVKNLSFTNTVHAQLGAGVPFGGRILTPYPCTCSASWLLFITPLPPTYATMLTYFPGTQAYLSYNLPFSMHILGKYVPGSACLVWAGFACIPLPTQGTITPMVGSSAI